MALLDYSLRILIAAATVGFVLIVFRVRSGAARHAAWLAVLVAMMTMPVLTAIVPRVEVPVPSTLALHPGTVAEQFLADDAADRPQSRGLTAPVTFHSTTSASRFTAQPVAGDRITWWRVAVFLYGSGVLWFLLRLVVGWSLARRIVRKANRVALPGTRIVESDVVAAPLTTGIVRPTVVLPTHWRSWSADTLRAVLAHEQAHIRRCDPIISLLAQVNRAVFWFHPLAWWLVRALSQTAEHACDDRVVRELGEPRRYAEILLDMAAAVGRRGSRVAWPAMGVDGSGMLGVRIDRLLRGDVFARMSLTRRMATASACAAAVLLAIACRQQIVAPPLHPDPEVQQAIEANQERTRKFQVAIAMKASEAAALEAAMEQNPKDLDIREQLLTYYSASKTVEWNDKLPGIRRHSLWLIENAAGTHIRIPVISRRYDPDGYERSKQLWLEQTAKPDVSAQVLAKAADYLSTWDKPLAEELLLRGQSIDPESKAARAGVPPGLAALTWNARLGRLYATAITGTVDPAFDTRDSAQAASAFAGEARRKLDATTNATILRMAAAHLNRFGRDLTELRELGRHYLERAAQFAPDDIQVKTAMAHVDMNDRLTAIAGAVRAAGARDRLGEFTDTSYAAVSALPIEDRLFYLPHAAESAYMQAEYIEFSGRDKPEDQKAESQRKADAGWNRSKRYAEDALTLARSNLTSPAAAEADYRANIVLALLALKEGDRQRSVEYMSRAANAPASETLRYMPLPGLRGRLVEYLLREGERESVAVFLARSAALNESSREQLLKDAAQIRSGVMPRTFQYAQARR